MFFQIRKYSEHDIRLVGYLSDEANLSISRNKGFSEEPVIVFPHIFNEFKNETEIKLDNCITVEARHVEYPNHTQITILEIKKRLIKKAETVTQSVTDIDKNIPKSNITNETSRIQNNYYNSQIHSGIGDNVQKFPTVGSEKDWHEKPLGIVILAVIVAGIVYFLGWN